MPTPCSRPRVSSSLVALAVAFAAPVAMGDDAKLKFEVSKDRAGEYRWALKAANGMTLATAGQGYKDRAGAAHGIDVVKKLGTDDKLKFEVYEDTRKEFRWRLKSGNGQTVAVSSEGYKEKAGAEKAAELVKAGASKAEVVDVKE